MTTRRLARLALLLALALSGRSFAAAPSSEIQVRQAVEAFYAAFNAHDFSRVSAFTTEDWVHINPLGGVTRGRDQVLAELHEVHSTFLKGVTDKPETIEIAFVTDQVALAIVPSRMSPHTTPDGIRRENQGQLRTFVLCAQNGRWLIKHDQNTFRR